MRNYVQLKTHKSVNKVELGLKFSFQVFFTLAEFEPYAFEIFGLW